MKKDINSNGYIFLYSTILVVVVAVLLTAAAFYLAPYQQRNKDNETYMNILSAAGIPNVTKENAQQLFKKHCTDTVFIDNELPLYIVNDGTKDINVIPLHGKGLWGPIWGYIAIADDGNTVMGANFDHKSETPGLGGEITSEKFQSQFRGKTILKNDKFVSIKVQKGGILGLPEDDRNHAVDAITGGTITSRGVDEMIDKVLQQYLPYLKTRP